MNRRCLLASLALLPLMAGCERTPAAFRGIDLTDSGFGREFKLQDVDGRERTLADFRGKYLLIFFGYVQCPDVCPTALMRAIEVRKLLGADGERVQVAFITVDPERDTPELLKSYMRAFDSNFVALSGTPERIRETAKEFRVFYAKVPTGNTYAVDHTAITYVVDPKGRLRLGMRHSQVADDFVADLRTLMKSETL